MSSPLLAGLDAGDRPSTAMRLVAALLGARARRREGRPVDLATERRANDRVTRLLRVPAGVTLTEEVLGGVPVVRLSSGGRARGTVLYLHGGAYVLGSARQALTIVGTCIDGGPDVVSVEYRLAPEHPFPAAVDDAIAVYRALLADPGPDRLVAIGESAGGGLLLLLLQRALAEGLPVPVAAVPVFPVADLSLSGDSAATNQGRDMLTRSELDTERAWFAGDRDLTDPAVSPLFGSFTGFPPTWIPVGTRDLLLDDARRVAAAMARDGVDVRLVEWPGATHAFTALPVPEGRRHQVLLRQVIDRALPAPTGGTVTSTPTRGRRRFAVLGSAVRAAKALPAPLQERLLDGATGGITGNLPPFADVRRLLEAAGGLPYGHRWADRLLGQRPDLRAVRTRDVSSDDGGRLRARVYLPPAGAAPAVAALVWVHGGAFVLGALDQPEAHWPALELAAAGIPVVSVDYRQCLNGLSYPLPQDDVLTAWRWAREHAAELGVTPDQLHLGGGSAGGCLVAGATLRLRDAGEPLPASLYLAYPVLQGRLPAPTPTAAAELAQVKVVDDAWVQAMVDNWAGTHPQEDPYVSPGLADPAGMPPTYVLSCGADSLRRASEPFADRLAEAGVPVWHDLLTGAAHAPLDRPGTPDGEQAVTRLRTWLTGGVTAMDS